MGDGLGASAQWYIQYVNDPAQMPFPRSPAKRNVSWRMSIQEWGWEFGKWARGLSVISRCVLWLGKRAKLTRMGIRMFLNDSAMFLLCSRHCTDCEIEHTML